MGYPTHIPASPPIQAILNSSMGGVRDVLEESMSSIKALGGDNTSEFITLQSIYVNLTTDWLAMLPPIDRKRYLKAFMRLVVAEMERRHKDPKWKNELFK